MDIHTDAPGVAAPEAISTALDTGSGERGTEIVAHTGTNAHLDLIAEINSEHRLATRCAQDAVQHAIRCGYLLTAQKKELPHGEFSKWIEIHCEFAYSTAARYMTAAKQISTGVEIPTLSALFPSGRKATKKRVSTEEMASAMEADTAECSFLKEAWRRCSESQRRQFMEKVKPFLAAQQSREPRIIEGDSPLMTDAPSVRSRPQESPNASVELAVKVLKAAVLAGKIQSPRCVGHLTDVRSAVTRLRNELAKAEHELAETELEVRGAYKELKAKEARE